MSANRLSDVSLVLPTCYTSNLFSLVKIDADVRDVSVPLQSAVNMDEERLIYEVEKRHILYDPRPPFSKDIIKKDEVWKEIGKLQGVTNKQTVLQLYRKREKSQAAPPKKKFSSPPCAATSVIIYLDNFSRSIC